MRRKTNKTMKRRMNENIKQNETHGVEDESQRRKQAKFERGGEEEEEEDVDETEENETTKERKRYSRADEYDSHMPY